MKWDNAKKQPNTWSVMWHAKLIDAGDGSGDQLIELPDDLLDQLGWKVANRVSKWNFFNGAVGESMASLELR